MFNEMLTYLIASAKNTDTALNEISKTLKKQARFNRRIGLLAVAGGVYVVWSEHQRQEQESKITELTRKVEELQEKGA